jgi:hypothetical protein
MVRGLHARVGGFGPERTASNCGLDLDSGDACRRTSSRDPPALTNECFAKTAGGTLHAVDRPSVGWDRSMPLGISKVLNCKSPN